MKRQVIVAALLLGFVLNASGFSQSSNGSMSGIVQDPSGALIPGVTITLTNNGTGIVSTTLSKGTQVRNFQGQLRFTF